MYVGQQGGMEEELAAHAGIPFRSVETGPILGRTPWVIVRNLMRMQRGASQCAKIIQEYRPDVVFLTGGYVAAPVAWAAWRARPRVPVLIYLPDLTPGWSIRVTSRIADRVAVSFPEVSRYFKGKAVVTGYPVRPELFTASRAEALATLGLTSDLPVVLVFGGSRGAHNINKALSDALQQLLVRCQIVHISGPHDWHWVSGLAEALPPDRRTRYHAFEYLHEEMISALAAANLVVTRAGASTLGEFPALGLPSILVPYPYAGQHQEANAGYLADRGAAVVLRDAALGDELASTIMQLLDSPKKLGQMAVAARNLAHPDAAARIMEQLLILAHGRRSETKA